MCFLWYQKPVLDRGLIISHVSLVIHNCLLQLFSLSSQAKIKGRTCLFRLLPGKLHYPSRITWLWKSQSEWEEAAHKDKLSMSRKWSCYQTANCSPWFLWIFEWVTKNSSLDSKQLWQLKLPGKLAVYKDHDEKISSQISSYTTISIL